MNFLAKNSGRFVISAFLAAGFYLCSCSNEDSDNTTLAEMTEAILAAADTTSTPSDSSSTDSTTKDSSAKDSTATDSTSTDSTAADLGRVIRGYVSRGFVTIGSEITLHEVDSTLAPTGKVFRGTVTDSSGFFSIPHVELTQPYIRLELNGSVFHICTQSQGKAAPTTLEAYANTRKGDTVNMNVLTYMQAKRLPQYIENGLSFDSAISASQAEMKKFFMMDSLHEDFNKLNLVTPQKENYYLLAATLYAETYMIDDEFDQIITEKVLDDSTYSWAWGIAQNHEERTLCRPLAQHIQQFGYTVDTLSLKSYFDKVWVAKYALGECSSKNYHEIKGAAFNERVRLYCEPPNWVDWDYCIELDTILLNRAGSDTTAGKLTKGIECARTYYHWDNSEWKKANNLEIELNRACTAKTEDEYAASGEKCYHCENGTWKFESTIFCKMDAKAKLLYDESEKKPCGDEEYFRKGLIDTTIYYHCYRGELSYADEFDMAMGHGCNVDHVGYYRYQNSIYRCNGFIWKYASDSLVTDSITDKRDNSVYKTVGIGKQVWMAQNLNLAIDSSWCPNDSIEYCNKYGRFYRWDVVLGKNPTEAHICPEGFHVPSNKEWEEMIEFATPWFPKKVASLIFASKNAMERSDGIERGEDLVGLSIYMLGSRSLNGAYSGWLFGAHMCSSDYTDSTSYIYKISRDTHEFLPYEQRQNLSCNIRCIKD